MLNDQMLTKLANIAFPDEETKLFAIIDGASVPELLPKLDEYQPPCSCLFGDMIEPDMAEVAPYLVQLENDSEFTQWLLTNCWGNHWGILAMSHKNLRTIQNDLEKIINVRNEKGEILRFRFYDPRVILEYLPTCYPNELKYFFNSIDQYIAEDKDSKYAWKLTSTGEELNQQQISLLAGDE